MASIQDIIAAYNSTVGTGQMTEAQFAGLAPAYGVTPAQLVAAQASLLGANNPAVLANLQTLGPTAGLDFMRELPQAQVLDYLRATTPTQTTITPTFDPNAYGVTSATGPGGEVYRPIFTGGAGEGEVPQLTGYQRDITQFDPRYAGGVYGTYGATYDPTGQLQDIAFRQDERSGGFINENQELLGNLAIAALTGGAGLFPQLGSIGSAAATGAVLGAGRAAVNDQDILRGALTGGALAGVTAGAADYLRSLGTPTTTLTEAGAPGEVLSSFQTLDDAAASLNWGADPFGAELSFGQQATPGFGPTTAAAVATPTPTTTTPTTTTPTGGAPTVGQVAAAGAGVAGLKELAGTARDVRDVVSTGDTVRGLLDNQDDTVRQAIDDALRDAGLDDDRAGDLTDDQFRDAITRALRDSGYDLTYDEYGNIAITEANRGTQDTGGLSDTLRDLINRFGSYAGADWTTRIADWATRNAGTLGSLVGSRLTGGDGGMSSDERALLQQQLDELQRAQAGNRTLFDQRMQQAQALGGEARYFDPEYFGLQRARRAQLAGAKAKRAGLRGLTGPARLSEQRRFDLATARDVGTSFDEGYLTGTRGRLGTMEAGLRAMPTSYPTTSSEYSNLRETYSEAQERARRQARDIGGLIGSIFDFNRRSQQQGQT